MYTNIYFDTIILTSIILAVLLIILLRQEIAKKRRPKRYLQFLIFIVALGGLTIFYGSFIEPELIAVNKTTIYLNKNTTHIKVALLSDLHVGPYKKEKYIKRVADKLLKLNPDLVLIAGDHTFGNDPREVKYLLPLKEVAQKIPTYAISGNHEYNIKKNQYFDTFFDISQIVKDTYESIGVNYLENESALIKIKNAKFWLLGIDDLYAGNDNLRYALKFTDNNYPKIVFVHNPDLIKQITGMHYNIDLVLAGHTHGGQIRLPLWGPVAKIPTRLGRHFDQGLFFIKKIPLFITSGIGESGARARLFNPPEIALLDIVL